MEELSWKVLSVETIKDAEKAYCCMTEVPTPWQETLGVCREWIANNLGDYVEGYHLELDGGEVVGQIYYALSDRALIPYKIDPGMGVIYCEWVQKRFRGKGLGSRLYAEFLAEMKRLGVGGIFVEAMVEEGMMHYQPYLDRGFEIIYERDPRRLLFLNLRQGRPKVLPMEPRIRPRKGTPVEIVIINGFMCPYEVSTHISLRDVAREFGERVVLKEVWLTPEILEDYGVARGVFINGRQKLMGAETEEAIRMAISEEL